MSESGHCETERQFRFQSIYLFSFVRHQLFSKLFVLLPLCVQTKTQCAWCLRHVYDLMRFVH